MKELEKIIYDENLSEFDLSKTAPCDDRIMTKLTLDDYDWMVYRLETYFPTKNQGFLYVIVEYSGSTVSEMTVEQKFYDSEEIIKHYFDFNTDIFVDFLKDFLTKHLDQWNHTYAFNGGKEAIELYNAILDDSRKNFTKE